MTTSEADEIVLSQLLAQASGVRMRAKNPLVGTRAGLLEQELAKRLAKIATTVEAHRDTTAQELEPVGAQNAGGAQ